jgi:hypothetical protein
MLGEVFIAACGHAELGRERLLRSSSAIDEREPIATLGARENLTLILIPLIPTGRPAELRR